MASCSAPLRLEDNYPPISAGSEVQLRDAPLKFRSLCTTLRNIQGILYMFRAPCAAQNLKECALN